MNDGSDSNNNNQKDTPSMNDWAANMLARIDALPEPDLARSHMLREQGRAYEILRLAASEGQEFDDAFIDKFDAALPVYGSAFKTILSIASEASSVSIMTRLEKAITDAELFEQWAAILNLVLLKLGIDGIESRTRALRATNATSSRSPNAADRTRAVLGLTSLSSAVAEGSPIATPLVAPPLVHSGSTGQRQKKGRSHA